jgi:Leucine-rich repeat (LRR) protein
LKELHLQHNKIKTLNKGIFKNLENLEKLNLSDNKIEYLGSKICENNNNLGTLSLGSNIIIERSFEVFAFPSKLKKLLLENNTCVNRNFDFSYWPSWSIKNKPSELLELTDCFNSCKNINYNISICNLNDLTISHNENEISPRICDSRSEPVIPPPEATTTTSTASVEIIESEKENKKDFTSKENDCQEVEYYRIIIIIETILLIIAIATNFCKSPKKAKLIEQNESENKELNYIQLDLASSNTNPTFQDRVIYSEISH